MAKDLYAALRSAIYVSAMQVNGKTIETDDQRLRASGLYDDWRLGNHTVGEIYNTHSTDELGSEWEQTWECYQAYDNAVYPDISPGNAAWYTFNRPLHGKTPATARPWVAPTHAEDIFRYGECMIWTDGTVRRCIAENGTNFSPDENPAAWEVA